ncbi:MAG: hypothetical protein V4850_23520 [Myxococcota bacterium]
MLVEGGHYSLGRDGAPVLSETTIRTLAGAAAEVVAIRRSGGSATLGLLVGDLALPAGSRPPAGEWAVPHPYREVLLGAGLDLTDLRVWTESYARNQGKRRLLDEARRRHDGPRTYAAEGWAFFVGHSGELTVVSDASLDWDGDLHGAVVTRGVSPLCPLVFAGLKRAVFQAGFTRHVAHYALADDAWIEEKLRAAAAIAAQLRGGRVGTQIDRLYRVGPDPHDRTCAPARARRPGRGAVGGLPRVRARPPSRSHPPRPNGDHMQADPGSGAQLAEREFPLFRVIDGVREHEGKIVARVEERRVALAARTGLTGRPLADALARDLVEDAALRTAAIGASAALPLTLPVLGMIGSTLLTVLGGALWQAAVEVELCYAIGAAYRTRMPSERVRTIAFWLVRLANYGDLQERALAMGVRFTVRKLVEKLVAIGLARAVAATAGGMMMGGMMGRAVVGAPVPWYVRATSFIGVPVLAVIGWRSTQGVGERAIAYFSEEG